MAASAGMVTESMAAKKAKPPGEDPRFLYSPGERSPVNSTSELQINPAKCGVDFFHVL